MIPDPDVSPLVQVPRAVERLVVGQPTTDGAGVKLTRVLTQDLQARLDPFLMLDNFASDDPRDYGAGFPSHPHRGFETISYMLSGRMRHRDSAGHEGLVADGGVQWMTAGRGVVHSEMPEQVAGVMEGFQLWLNLPGRDKLCPPWYRDFQRTDVPEARTDHGTLLRVIAGTAQLADGRAVAGAVRRPASDFPTDPLILDIHLSADGLPFSHPVPAGHNAFVYVYRGTALVLDADGAATPVPRQRMAILGRDGDGLTLRSDPAQTEPARALLVAGKPLREPIAQYGPFVMNTREELVAAVNDFNAGRLG